ncbi:MAG: LysE family transporter [Anaerolineae bacterium]|nr:LysE family transporter [Anaerolineae bacterium]
MLALVSQGISLGFSAGAMPGPFNSYLIGATLLLGWRRALIIVLTPLITDGPIILLAVVLLRQIPADWIRVIQLVGGLYLIWVAYGAWRRFRQGVTLTADTTATGRTLAQGLLMNWLSPGPYIFWATINGPLLIQALNQSVWAALAFLAAFYGTFLGILVGYVIVFDRLRRLDERFTRAILLVTVLVMLLFGVSLILQGLQIRVAA